MKKFAVAVAALVGLPASACAQTGSAGNQSASSAPATAPANPCEAEPYRAFDFWIGEWEVFATNGNKAGENSITVEEGGCLLLEKWTDAQGGTGQSYNFYDPATKKFRQVWVSRGAVIDYGGGLDDEGRMAMEGEIRYHNGTTVPFRGLWTLQDDGSVRQHFEQYNAETETWNAWFTGIYRRKDAADGD